MDKLHAVAKQANALILMLLNRSEKNKLGPQMKRDLHFANLVAAVIFGLAREYSLRQQNLPDYNAYDVINIDAQLEARSRLMGSIIAGTFDPATEWGPGTYYFNSSVLRLVALSELVSRITFGDDRELFLRYPLLRKLRDRRIRIVHSKVLRPRSDISYEEVIKALELILGLYNAAQSRRAPKRG